MLRCKKNISSFHQPKSAGSSEPSTTTDFFEMHDLTFRSTRPGEWMRPLEDKRKAMDTTPCRNRATTKRQTRDDQATNAR